MFSSPIPFKRAKFHANSTRNQNNTVTRNENALGVTGKELEEIYRISRRCSQIEQNLKGKKWRMANFRATVQVADLIFSQWESASATSSSHNDYRQRKQHFANYVVGFVMRIGPCVATLLHGLIFCLNLRQMYPQARGEPGCSHRLFVVSLLVATRYLNDRQVLIKPNHASWSALSGVFTAMELERMEIEFVTFLRGKLFIGMSEVEKCVENLFVTILSDAGQTDYGSIVPGSVDWLEMISVCTSKSSNARSNDTQDAIVP